MAKYKTLESYFKRKSEDASGIANNENKRSRVSTDEPDQTQPHDEPRQHQNQPEARISETHKQTTEETGSGDLERDPAKRKAMWDYSVNEREQVRRAYLHLGPYQIHLKEYPAKASVDIVRWLVFQACAFRGNDESSNSRNRVYFWKIQKEILGIIAKEVRKRIRTEVGDSYFCVMVDESRDESKKEQMAIVLRFIDTNGVIREIFLDLVHVSDTSAITLKTHLWKKLLQYEFDTSKIRGQGYDGANNMRGEWNGLQALVCKDCPYAYYVHCFAHRLQLALVAASREVIPVHQFFTRLTFTINVVCASSKRHDELQKAKASETTQLLELGEIKKGKRKNQVGTLRRAGDTRWGSRFFSVCSMLKMFDATRVVLKGIMDDVSSCYAQKGDAALQKKSGDIFNAMELVSATKDSLSEFRNNGWDSFFAQVRVFCEKHQIEIPDMNTPYKSTRYRPRQKDNHVTFEHYYRVDIFISALDKQLYELNNRFNDQAMELLKLSSTLVPNKVFNIDDICLLVEKYYPADFTQHERLQLKYELELFPLKDKRTQS
ncbi:zinc finger MYM-type protein 1-like protein [Tanacetum coccineum]